MKSEVGQGSVFTFTVWFDHAEQEPIKQLAIPKEGIKKSVKALRVLVAEDGPVNQFIAVQMLQKLGHSAATVANGREAIEKLKCESFDLVLMDVQMPEMDGFEATRLLREEDLRNDTHLPIIALTAHAMVGDRERCEAAGMDGYLAKPIQIEKLDQVIQEVITGTSTSNVSR